MTKESNQQDSKKPFEEKKNSKKDKSKSEEIQEEILEIEQQEILEQEEIQENEEAEQETDFEKEIDSEDIEEEIENEEDAEEENSEEEIEDEESGEIKFNHWLESFNKIPERAMSRQNISGLESARVAFSSKLEQGLSSAPRIKDSREGKKYSNSKYEFSKYSPDAVKKYTDQTPGKDSNEEKNQ